MKSYMLKLSLLSVATAMLIGMSACSSSGGGGGDDDGTSSSTVLNGSASLSGTIASSSATSPSVSRVGASNVVSGVDEEASAVVTVDGNGDGVFGGTDIVYTSSVLSDGSFAFENIQIPEEGVTQAQLTVRKNGYAPVTKIVTLSNGQSASILADAAAMPVFTEVLAIDRNTTTAGSYLKIGMKHSATGVTSFAKIMSLSELRAEADDPSFGEDDLSTSVIPLDAIPDDVTEVRADMKAFDPTDPQDSKYFPGEYKGEGKDGATTPSRLVSVGFDLVSLTDQNGDPIELDTSAIRASKLRPQAVDWDNCLQTKVRYLGDTQVALIEQMGDDDNTTPEFEIPMWYYSYASGIWSYLGEAVYTSAADSANSRAYATMCVTENWGQYLNLDYDFAIERPKNLCIKATDQYDSPITSLNFTVRNGTAYSYAYSDANGEASVALTAGDNLDDYEITYYGYMSGWTEVQVDNDDIVANTTDDECDYDLDVVVQNPFSTTLQVTPLNIDGSKGEDPVYVSNSSYSDYFYRAATVDENGIASFKVKPNVTYRVQYRSTVVSVNANGAVVAPETADSTRSLSVTVQDENQAPRVSAYFRNNNISEKATKVKFYVSAEDANGDAITFDGLTLNGTALVEGTHYTLEARYQGTGYDYMYGELDLTNAEVSAITPKNLSGGSYDLQATFSDGTLSAEASATLEVLQNRAPVINGVYFYNTSTGRYADLNGVIPVGDYTIYAYAYDPNGDTVTLSYTLDDVTATKDVNLQNGPHTIVVSASDGNLSTSRSFAVLVGNHPPVVSYAGALSYVVDIASANNTIDLFAYVRDKEDGVNVKSVQAIDQNGTKYPFTFNASKYMYEAQVTPSAVGTYTFAIRATDNNDSNSSDYTVSVQTIENNQAPQFTYELVNETVNVNTEKTFRCTATDPEGTWVTYDWSVDGTHINNFSDQYTRTFSETGQVRISCTASDQDGESATTSATITVTDPTQTGTLIVNTQIPGLLVAIHDSATLEPVVPAQEALTDANGRASFNVVGDRTSFSVSLTSNTLMSDDMVLESVKAMLLGEAQSACSYQPDTNVTCSEMDWCAAYDADTIPNWVVDLNPPRDENGTVLATAEDFDANDDGVLNASEIMAAVLDMDDTNSDGKITWGEFNDDRESVVTQMYASVPVQEYNLPFSYLFEEREEPGASSYNSVQYIDGCSDKEESFDFNLTVTGLDPNTTPTFYVYGSGYAYKYTSVGAEGNVMFSVNAYTKGENGNYSFLVRNITDGNFTFFEANATALQAGVSVDAAAFKAPTEVEVVTPSAVGTYTFAIRATDNNDSNSSDYTVSVQTIENNQAPQFTYELVNETVNVNTEKTFRCTATDPEGTWVTYDWSVDGTHINNFSDQYTRTFSETGQVRISCTASDQDGESATTSATITVTDPTQTGTLIVNTQIPGLLVAIHDSATLEPVVPAQEALTDANGRASFNVVGDRTSFSVSLTSNTLMSDDMVLESVKAMLLGEAQSACSYQPDTNVTCSEMDWCAAYDADTIPNWVVDLNPPRDENGTVLATAEDFDANDDGVLNASEIMAAVLDMDDTNSDGKITWGEFNDDRESVVTQMYASVPVQEYNLPFSYLFEEREEPGASSYNSVQYIDGCSDKEESFDFNLTVTGLDPNTTPTFYVYGSGYAYKYTSVGAEGNVMFSVNAYTKGENGNYSFLVRNITDGNFTFFEANATALQAGVSVDAAAFKAPTEVEVVKSVSFNDYFSLLEMYNGLYFYTNTQTSTDTGYIMDVYPIDAAQYVISNSSSRYGDLGSFHYATSNYYGDGSLLARYNTADYPQLDIEFSEGTSGVEMGGDDVAKLNLLTGYMSSSTSDYQFNFALTTTQVANAIPDINVSKVLPQNVQSAISGFSQDMLEQNYLDGGVTVTEYKDKTESELLDLFVSGTALTTEPDFNAWYLVPRRYVTVYFANEGSAPLSSARTTTQSETRSLQKPFSIGLDVSKAW